MHHDIRDLAVAARRVRHLAAQEDARIRVHGRLVWRDRLVQLPDHDRFRVVEQVLADAGDVLHDRDPELFELLTRAQSGQQHQAWRVDCASAQDRLRLVSQRALFAALEG